MSEYITATTESNPQVIATWTSYSSGGSSWYWQLRIVAWISQNSSTLKTTIKYKWQVVQNNYYPYWNDSHTYTVSFKGTSDSVSFKLPQSQSNGTRDMCSARTLGTFSHNSTTGELSGTLSYNGARCGGYTSGGSYINWETFSYSEDGSVPTLEVPSVEPDPEPTPTPEPDREPDPPTPLEFDNDPRYYIYADDKLVYSAGVEGYEVLNPKLSVEVNKAGSLTFDIPVGSQMYSGISKLKTTVEARQGNEILFRGRLLNTKRNMMNTITCYCEGFIAWLNDMTTAPYEYTGEARKFLKQIITNYNTRASDNRKLAYVYSDISAKITIKTDSYSDLWKEAKSVLIDGVGGYVVPYLTPEQNGLQYLSTYGTSTAQVIQFGENLLDFEESIDASAVYTAIRPVGKEVNGTRVTIPEIFVTDAEAISRFGRIERVAIFDEITDVAALRSAAKDYLRMGVEQALTMKLKAVDLHLLDVSTERIRLGDSVRAVSVPHGVDAYFLCTKIDYDFAHPQNTVYTFGSAQRTISEMTDVSYNKYVITEGA